MLATSRAAILSVKPIVLRYWFPTHSRSADETHELYARTEGLGRLADREYVGNEYLSTIGLTDKKAALSAASTLNPNAEEVKH